MAINNWRYVVEREYIPGTTLVANYPEERYVRNGVTKIAADPAGIVTEIVASDTTPTNTVSNVFTPAETYKLQADWYGKVVMLSLLQLNKWMISLMLMLQI